MFSFFESLGKVFIISTSILISLILFSIISKINNQEYIIMTGFFSISEIINSKENISLINNYESKIYKEIYGEQINTIKEVLGHGYCKKDFIATFKKNVELQNFPRLRRNFSTISRDNNEDSALDEEIEVITSSRKPFSRRTSLPLEHNAYYSGSLVSAPKTDKFIFDLFDVNPELFNLSRESLSSKISQLSFLSTSILGQKKFILNEGQRGYKSALSDREIYAQEITFNQYNLIFTDIVNHKKFFYRDISATLKNAQNLINNLSKKRNYRCSCIGLDDSGLDQGKSSATVDNDVFLYTFTKDNSVTLHRFKSSPSIKTDDRIFDHYNNVFKNYLDNANDSVSLLNVYSKHRDYFIKIGNNKIIDSINSYEETLKLESQAELPILGVTLPITPFIAVNTIIQLFVAILFLTLTYKDLNISIEDNEVVDVVFFTKNFFRSFIDLMIFALTLNFSFIIIFASTHYINIVYIFFIYLLIIVTISVLFIVKRRAPIFLKKMSSK